MRRIPERGRVSSGEVATASRWAGARGLTTSPLSTRQDWMGKPWNDLRVPLELFVSPTVKEAAGLPAHLKTTTELLDRRP